MARGLSRPFLCRNFLVTRQTLRNLQHPHVIRILDVIDHPLSICFVMEFAAGGELRKYVESRGGLAEDGVPALFVVLVTCAYVGVLTLVCLTCANMSVVRQQ
jgi:hypothetical protein